MDQQAIQARRNRASCGKAGAMGRRAAAAHRAALQTRPGQTTEDCNMDAGQGHGWLLELPQSHNQQAEGGDAPPAVRSF